MVILCVVCENSLLINENPNLRLGCVVPHISSESQVEQREDATRDVGIEEHDHDVEALENVNDAQLDVEEEAHLLVCEEVHCLEVHLEGVLVDGAG